MWFLRLHPLPPFFHYTSYGLISIFYQKFLIFVRYKEGIFLSKIQFSRVSNLTYSKRKRFRIHESVVVGIMLPSLDIIITVSTN